MRRVYISCDHGERTFPEVERLCRFLKSAGCVLEWAPAPGWDSYRILEEAIDRCDAFVAVAASGYADSTWLNHELHYAAGLRRLRFSPRPRLFGLSVGVARLPRCTEDIEVEWLDSPHSFGKLLEDLPERG
jgi:hypothetical protein